MRRLDDGLRVGARACAALDATCSAAVIVAAIAFRTVRAAASVTDTVADSALLTIGFAVVTFLFVLGIHSSDARCSKNKADSVTLPIAVPELRR